MEENHRGLEAEAAINLVTVSSFIFECLWGRSAEESQTVTYATEKHLKIYKESDFTGTH